MDRWGAMKDLKRKRVSVMTPSGGERLKIQGGISRVIAVRELLDYLKQY